MLDKYYKQLSRNALPLLLFACAVFICLALMRYVAMPEWGYYLHIKDGLVRAGSDISEKNGLSVKERLVNINNSLLSAKSALSRDIGESRNLPGILQLVIKEANAADIRFVKMQQPADTSKAGAGNYPLVLELAATYNSLGKFISSIENLPHLMRIDRIAVTAGSNNTLEARIQLTCFLHSGGL